MKRFKGTLIISAAALIFASCGSDTSTADSENTTLGDSSTAQANMDHNMDSNSMGMGNTNNTTGMNASGALSDMSSPAAPSAFSMEAAAGSMMEIDLGNYASNNAANKDVKDYGKMMVTDHTKASDDLKRVVKDKNTITLPTAMPGDKQTMADQMKAMKGAEFDRAYINMMVDDHQKQLQMFKDAADKLTDAELKSFAADKVPVLQKHLDRAKEIQGKL